MPADHPLRAVRAMVEAALTEQSPEFRGLYSGVVASIAGVAVQHRGHKKAVIAVAHSMLVTGYHLLARKTTYQEPGADYDERRHAERVQVSVSGRRTRLFFQTKPDSYNTESLIAFLRDLKREFRGRRVVLTWDGLPAHKSREMAAFLRTQHAWLSVERLPGYAPELNPAEQLWGNVKGQELANYCAENLQEVAAALRKGMAPVRRRPSLAF